MIPRNGGLKLTPEWRCAIEYLASWKNAIGPQTEEQEIRSRALSRAEAPLVADLRSVGLPIESVWDLVNVRVKYPEALPILRKHLHRGYPPEIEEGIVRALGVPYGERQLGFNALVEFAMKRGADLDPDYQYALGYSIATLATKSEYGTLVSIIRNTNLGQVRWEPIWRLARLHNAEVPNLVESLLKEPGDAQSVAIKAATIAKLWHLLPLIEPFTKDHRSGVRKLAVDFLKLSKK